MLTHPAHPQPWTSWLYYCGLLLKIRILMTFLFIYMSVVPRPKVTPSFSECVHRWSAQTSESSLVTKGYFGTLIPTIHSLGKTCLPLTCLAFGELPALPIFSGLSAPGCYAKPTFPVQDSVRWSLPHKVLVCQTPVSGYHSVIPHAFITDLMLALSVLLRWGGISM